MEHHSSLIEKSDCIYFPWNRHLVSVFKHCSMPVLKLDTQQLHWEIPSSKTIYSLPASVCRLWRGAAMDAGKLEQQVACVERGIAFLKQEHLAMLTGLQLEITHLRKRCHGQCIAATGCSPSLYVS